MYDKLNSILTGGAIAIVDSSSAHIAGSNFTNNKAESAMEIVYDDTWNCPDGMLGKLFKIWLIRTVTR